MSLNISTNTAALKAGINLAYNTKQLHASEQTFKWKETELTSIRSRQPCCLNEITVFHQ